MKEPNLIKPIPMYRDCSKGKWRVLSNSGWGENKHGDHPGFIICHNNSHNQLVVIAEIIMPFKKITPEIEANAKLMAMLQNQYKQKYCIMAIVLYE